MFASVFAYRLMLNVSLFCSISMMLHFSVIVVFETIHWSVFLAWARYEYKYAEFWKFNGV